ncbi:MAG: LysE family translocator [Chloroflexi bacterium]|nr:LysE family translocator [Chloroflexota bacterium]
MMDWSALTLFFVAAAVLLITPGPAVLYIVARSIDQGRMAGIVSVWGVGVGTFFHVAAAAIGLSAILVSSAVAFSVVKYLGAVYLVYLGVRKLLEKDNVYEGEATTPKTLSRIFYQGVVINVLNPKTALFFFAFLPQFVNPQSGSVTTQMLILGVIFIVMGLLSDSVYAVLAGTVGNWLRGNMGFLRSQRYFAGTIYILLGVLTAVSGTDKK